MWLLLDDMQLSVMTVYNRAPMVIQTLIRDGQLHFFAQFRSQNVWNYHCNFKGLYELQRMMLVRLEERGLKVNQGGLTVDITAAHIYEFDFKVAERLLC